MPSRAEVGPGGCRVSGRWLTTAGAPVRGGSFWLQPEREAVWRGVVYTADKVVITPDPQGRWEVTLPPSSAVGVYTVEIGTLRFKMVVPDGQAVAEFAEIARVE